MRNYPSIGLQVPDILLPRPGTDMTKWAVIACDQFTSEPEYWDQVKRTVGSAPSTLHMILPEVYLGTPEESARVQSTRQSMHGYLEQGLLQPQEGLIYLERTVAGRTRHGLLLALDLEFYDYNKGSQTLIRASEGTILDRLPPRIRIREGAPLEVPHILVLIDDPGRTVIEPLASARLAPLYDFDLMLGSGHVRAYRVEDRASEQRVVSSLAALADPNHFHKKYGGGSDRSVLLYAVGDGNHSLATAKAIWEKVKATVGMEHPARYALVELENVHDQGLQFEPIHRVLFNLRVDIQSALAVAFGETYHYTRSASHREMAEAVAAQEVPGQAVGFISAEECGLAHFAKPSLNLPVGTVQAFLDDFLKDGGASKIDYVHGQDVVTKVGMQPGNLGIYLPAMAKTDLFKTVILDGALPRKTFSMGEAREKRFYVECRRIT
jgi:hypothetical protein